MRITDKIKRLSLLGALLLLMVVSSACSPDNSAAVEEQVSLTLTAIYLAQPTSTNTEVPTPTAVPTDTPLPPTDTAAPPPTEPVAEVIALEVTEPPKESCLRLVGPENDIFIPTLDKQTFEWEPHPEAAQYRLEFIPPPYHKGQTFETNQTSLYRWMNTLPWDGDYSWQVSALDSAGQVICTSNPRTFSKSTFRPTGTFDANSSNNRYVTPAPYFTPCIE